MSKISLLRSLLLPLLVLTVLGPGAAPAEAHWLIHHKSFINPDDTIRELELAARLHDDFLRAREGFNLANARQTAAMLQELRGETGLSEAFFRESRKTVNLSSAAITSTLEDLEVLDRFVREREKDLVPGFAESFASHAADVVYQDPVSGEVLIDGIATPDGAMDAYRLLMKLLDERTRIAQRSQKEALPAVLAGEMTRSLMGGELSLEAAWQNLGATWSAVSKFLEEMTLATIRAAQDVFPAGLPRP